MRRRSPGSEIKCIFRGHEAITCSLYLRLMRYWRGQARKHFLSPCRQVGLPSPELGLMQGQTVLSPPLMVDFAFTGSDTKLQKGSLQKFFNLNNDLVTGKDSIGSDQSTINATSKSPEKKVPSLHSLPLRCKQHSTGSLGKKLCTKKHISSAVKKSFRPHYYDDDEDYDDPRDDYDETLDDEEIPEEDVTGSYRAFEDSPPRYDDDSSERFRDYESEDDHESWRGHEFEDEPLGRPGYEDDLEDESDRWDSEQPRRHHGTKSCLVFVPALERFSIQCRKTQRKEITPVIFNLRRQRNEPITIIA